MVKIEGVGGADEVEIHQLLCGRDICKDWRKNIAHQMAMQFNNYIYVVKDLETNTCTIVDGCYDVEGIEEYCRKELDGCIIKHCVYTHHHPDHIGGKLPKQLSRGKDLTIPGMAEMHEKVGCKVYIGKKDLDICLKLTRMSERDVIALNDGDQVPIGSSDKHYLDAVSTPGHTHGSFCFSIKQGYLITGDTLFIGSCGRYDLPNSDFRLMLQSLSKLGQYPKDYLVLPGHNYAVANTSTIEQEQSTNFMMIQALSEGKNPNIKINPTGAFLNLPDFLDIANKVFEVEKEQFKLDYPFSKAKQ